MLKKRVTLLLFHTAFLDISGALVKALKVTLGRSIQKVLKKLVTLTAVSQTIL